MLKYWINILQRKPTVRVWGPGNALLYRENGRAIKIGIQMTAYGYSIDPSTIISWEDAPERVLSETEQRRIADSAVAVVRAQWGARAFIQNGSL